MIYDFENTLTGEVVQLEMSLSEREIYLQENPHMEQRLFTPPRIIDPWSMGRIPQSGKDFNKYVVGRMKNAIPKNNLDRSRFSVPVEV